MTGSVLIRRAAEGGAAPRGGIRWPALKLCERRRVAPEGIACICRTYDGAEGYYVLEGDGHACSYYKDRKDALRHVQSHHGEHPKSHGSPAPTVPDGIVGIGPTGIVSTDAPPTGQGLFPPPSGDPR